MIAFIVPVSDLERYEAIAAPGIETALEPDSVVRVLTGDEPLQLRLNRELDELAEAVDLEAAVVLHEDVLIRDGQLAAKLREVFADDTIALAGPIGASSVSSLAWWDGVAVGRVSAPHGDIRGLAAPGDVETLDGLMLCLSPWSVRNLRFDPALAADFHGYDVDLCFQARFHGRRVVAIDLDVYHDHRPLFDQTDGWVRNELRFQQRWFSEALVSLSRHEALGSP